MQVQCLVTCDIEAVQAMPTTAWNVDPPLIHVEVVVGDLLGFKLVHVAVKRSDLADRSGMLSLEGINITLRSIKFFFESIDLRSLGILRGDEPLEAILHRADIRLESANMGAHGSLLLF